MNEPVSDHLKTTWNKICERYITFSGETELKQFLRVKLDEMLWILHTDRLIDHCTPSLFYCRRETYIVPGEGKHYFLRAGASILFTTYEDPVYINTTTLRFMGSKAPPLNRWREIIKEIQ